MNRRNFLQTTVLAVAGTTLITTLSRAADEKIGKLSAADFKKMNKEGGAKVSAIKAEAAPLSEADQKLMLEVAAGGMMQLEVSRIAADKATDADVKAIAKAEVEEQTVLSAKLKEIAKAKKITLPDEPDDKTKKMVAMLQGKSGADLDRTYLENSGVKGHEMLQKTMTKVQDKAQDPALKSLATAALPLIQTHLEVSRDEIAAMAA
ncbi:MAG TPA: DUF4142 domain-containing protein [Chthoniobacteraceae bacterium]|jgi:putative membrane protein